MDEFSVVLRARNFVRDAGPPVLPPSVETYVDHIGGVLRHESDLPDDEPGYSFESNGKHFICVNEKDSEERQRFTACHEIAHIVLGLPSEHSAMPWWSYASRPKNEILCDVFAAELLLPKQLFEPLVREERIGFTAIDDLADRFMASTTATGSRYATVMDAPCAFVLSEKGVVRYASRSNSLRDAGGWIPPRIPVPSETLSAALPAGGTEAGPDEVAADVWFSDWRRGGAVLEAARYLRSWDQTFTLLWFEDEEVPPPLRRVPRRRFPDIPFTTNQALTRPGGPWFSHPTHRWCQFRHRPPSHERTENPGITGPYGPSRPAPSRGFHDETPPRLLPIVTPSRGPNRSRNHE